MKAYTFGQHHILVQFRGKLAALGRFDPGVVVDCGGISIWGVSAHGGWNIVLTSSLDVAAIFIPVEPDVCNESASVLMSSPCTLSTYWEL